MERIDDLCSIGMEPSSLALPSPDATGIRPSSPAGSGGKDGGDVGSLADMTCAICLDQVQPANTAIVKGCEHCYCVNCILRWAVCKEPSTCPQCKHPFSYLYVHRQLDGTLSDCLLEESIVLLKRAQWFQEHIRVLEKGPELGASSLVGPEDYGWPEDEDEEDDDDAYAEDDDIEAMYYSRATGRARVVIGNRRWGENGLVRGGRMFARPVAPAPPVPAANPQQGAGARTPAGKQVKGAAAAASGAAGASAGAGGSGLGRNGSAGAAGSGSSSRAAGAAAGAGSSGGAAVAAGSSSGIAAAASSSLAVAASADTHAEAVMAASPAGVEAGSAVAAGDPAAAAEGLLMPAVAPATPSATSGSGTINRAVAGGSGRKNQVGRPGNRAGPLAGPAGAAGGSGNGQQAAAAAPAKPQGRRAKRNNRRAVADWDDDYGDY